MIKITLLETNRVHIQIDEKTVQVATDRTGYTVVQGTSTAQIQVNYNSSYRTWDKSVIMTNAQSRSIRKELVGEVDQFTFNLPLEMTIAPYTKLLFQAIKDNKLQRWTVVDIPIARTAEGQMPPIPSTDAEEIRQIAQDAKDTADEAIASVLNNSYYADETTIELKNVEGKDIFSIKQSIIDDIAANTELREGGNIVMSTDIITLNGGNA